MQKGQQRVNYLRYHVSVSMRIAEDASMHSIDGCVWNLLYILWNETKWANVVRIDPYWIMEAAHISNIRTYKDSIQRLHDAGYINVQAQRGNGGGTYISFLPLSESEQSKRGNTALLNRAILLHLEGKKTGSKEFVTGQKCPIKMGKSAPFEKGSNRAKVPLSYTTIPIVQTTVTVKETIETVLPDSNESGPVVEKFGTEKSKTIHLLPKAEKEKKVAPKKEKEPAQPKTEYWNTMIAAWEDFYQNAKGSKPMFGSRDARDLKELLAKLKKLVQSHFSPDAPEAEWTETNAVNWFKNFLAKALKMPWIGTHYSLQNINSQFNIIANEKQSPSTTHRAGQFTGNAAALADVEQRLAELTGNAGYHSC